MTKAMAKSKGDKGQLWWQPCSILKYSEYTSLVWMLALGIYVEGESKKAIYHQVQNSSELQTGTVLLCRHQKIVEPQEVRSNI